MDVVEIVAFSCARADSCESDLVGERHVDFFACRIMAEMASGFVVGRI